MSKLDTLFKKIAAATATGGGNNIRDGRYKFLIEKCHIQEGHTGTCLIAEFRVMEAAASGALDEQGKPVIPNPVGSTCSMVCNVTKHESAYGNVKAFVQGALGGLGYTPDKIDDQVLAEVFSDANPLRGVAVIDETYRGVNKGRANAANAGKPLTLNKWKSIAQTQEEVQAQAQYLDENVATAEVVQSTTTAATAAASATETVTEKPKSGGLLGAMKRD